MSAALENDVEMLAMVFALASAAVGSLVCVLALSMAPAWRRPSTERLRGRSVAFERQA
ncbi:MAG TPA: hypothetical protein VHL98_05595 [Microvirga sp.]|jgi:hypothetical protein|nr:hypothetical protein [Microvirga sp.]